MLTPEDLEKLARPFPLEAHSFNRRGFCYVKEVPTCARIEEVDSAWQFEVMDVRRSGIGDQLAVVTARLMIKGVYRSNTGMQAVEYVNEKKDGKTVGKTDIEAGEPEKGATTDALRRCARLFGVGRYILEMGESVRDQTALDKWLKERYAATKPPWWNEVGKQLIDHPHFNGISSHVTNALKRLLADNLVTPKMTPEQVMTVVMQKYPLPNDRRIS